MRFEVLTIVNIMIMIFWDVTLCNVVAYSILRMRNVGAYLLDYTASHPRKY
jgi:hypothetical protein